MAGPVEESALASLELMEPIVTNPKAWASFLGFHFEDKAGEASDSDVTS